uniref:LAGLIDADG homing endonuclease n=1 Tax=Knipowitschia caucasica TaxID=637954 RepID=A0AAV2L7Q9_KNICA
MWHGSKNLGKKIVQASQKKSCKSLVTWTKDICNHFWFCAKTASTFNDFFDIRNADGEVEYKRLFNKKSRQWRLYALRVEKDYAYIELQRAILQCRISSGKGMPKKMPQRHDDPLLAYGLLPAVPRPPKEELLQTQVSRGIGKEVQK